MSDARRLRGLNGEEGKLIWQKDRCIDRNMYVCFYTHTYIFMCICTHVLQGMEETSETTGAGGTLIHHLSTTRLSIRASIHSIIHRSLHWHVKPSTYYLPIQAPTHPFIYLFN